MGCPMRILKSTCDFHPDVETPIAPVWISFPLLPVYLCAKEFLFALSKIVGVPLRIDEATTDLLRPSEARVCVEVNLEHKLPDRIWIVRDESRSFCQPIVYESLPHFCAKCRYMGHIIDQCRVGALPVDPIVAQATRHFVAQAPKPAIALAPKPVDVQVPIVDTTMKGKDNGKEIVVEAPRQWALVVGFSTIAIPHLVVHLGTTHQPSKLCHDVGFSDPILDHMISIPHEFSIFPEPVQPFFDIDPYVNPRLSTNENVEASIPSDTASSIQLEVHLPGLFCRNSYYNLVGLDERQEADGFTAVQRKKKN
ncbi:Uncharacterized protein Adt_13817 [Abeliophyllum distichum]|uniref:DUF4283 domain-containing protein n=1 Tax=Abeliophyllum distichum TaxID=126358 RepID=A0ABD1TXW6_9LAMI